MSRVGRTGGVLGMVGMAVLALLVVPALAAPASASQVSPAVGSTQQWAYGGEKWVNTTVILTNATLTERAFFGWDVIFTATNTSLTTQAWEAQRTMAGYFYVNYTSPSSSGSFSLQGWEVDTGFANFTTAASVYENGSAVAAVGLQNASFRNAANLTESLSVTLSTGPITGTSSSALDIAGTAHGAVQFTPALGLVPLLLTNATHWNSSSAFAAAGGWSVNYTILHTPFSGSSTWARFNASGSVASTGNVLVYGADLGTVTLKNGVTVPVVLLAWVGPFDDVDGMILIPHDFDLFGTGSHSWDGADLGTETVATSDLDVRVGSDHHLNVVAAASSFGSAATTLPVSTAVTAGSGPTPMATSSSPTVVQGQPESVPQAQQNAACLTGACAGGSALRSLVVVYVAVGLVGLVVAGGVGLVLFRRHRRGGAGPAAAPPTQGPPPGAVGMTPPDEPSAR